MAIEIEKLDEGYLVKTDYPDAIPARRTAYTDAGAMLRQVIRDLRLADTWDVIDIVVLTPGDGDFRPPAKKVL